MSLKFLHVEKKLKIPVADNTEIRQINVSGAQQFYVHYNTTARNTRLETNN